MEGAQEIMTQKKKTKRKIRTWYGFNTKLTMRLGTARKALMWQAIAIWMDISEAKGVEKCFFDGRWWTYQTYSHIQQYYPWLTRRKIEIVLKSLEKAGEILVQFDPTKPN